MKIIALEGLDKSGKFSQSNLLLEYLRAKGFSVEKSEFHRYDTPTGALIMKWLTKEWDADQHTIELIMAADKQAQQKWFSELEEAGTDILILDRYTGSQLAYSVSNQIDEAWASMLQTYMRKPDLEILIDIPAEESMARKGKHNNGENDRYESDRLLLKRVRETYNKNISIVVDGMQPIDKVHRDIISVLQLWL